MAEIIYRLSIQYVSIYKKQEKLRIKKLDL